ncbi:MAG: Fe-S cluster assembly sulfur transfer protein SufU [Myxococcota bacterium]
MQDEVTSLYQELILDHNTNPRHFGPLPDATAHAVGDNPLCGDHIEVQLRLSGNVIQKVHFSGQGCAIAKASASMMTQAVRGQSPQQAQQLFNAFHALVKGEAVRSDVSLGKLDAFAGVGRFPMRVKCAILAWHALRAALQQQTGDEL